MMPKKLALVASLFVLPMATFALQPGDTRDAVIAELGAPNGSVAAGDRVVMYYDRGTVQLRDGRVAAVNLVSAAELAAREAKEAAAMQRMEEATQARRTRLEAEGNAIHAARKADASFAALPADTQLGYWRQFAMRFPMISVENEIAPLSEIVDQQIRLREVEAANADRLAELEDRLAETEERAARAERMARYHRYRPPIYRPFDTDSLFLFPGQFSIFDTPRHRVNFDQRSHRRDDRRSPNRSPGVRRPVMPYRPFTTAPVQAFVNPDNAPRRAYGMR
jgi:hypothetical protein